MQNSYTLADLEAAINYWRARLPSQGEALCLCAEASALAEPYALMIFNAQSAIEQRELSSAALEALAQWHRAQAGS